DEKRDCIEKSGYCDAVADRIRVACREYGTSMGAWHAIGFLKQPVCWASATTPYVVGSMTRHSVPSETNPLAWSSTAPPSPPTPKNLLGAISCPRSVASPRRHVTTS